MTKVSKVAVALENDTDHRKLADAIKVNRQALQSRLGENGSIVFEFRGQKYLLRTVPRGKKK